MKMKIIDRYIYRSLILPTIFGVSIFTFILMLNVLIEVMEKLFTSDLPLISIIDYFFYTTPGILVQTLPMGAFLGIMLVYGNFSESNEIVAMEGLGISIFRIIRPAILFGIFLTIIGLLLEIYVNPRALDKINKQTNRILLSKPSSLTEEKIFLTNNESGFGFYIDKVNNERGEIENFLILKREENNSYPGIFLAERGEIGNGTIEMENVRGFSFNKEGQFQVGAKYEKQSIPVKSFFKLENNHREKSRSEMNIKELKKYYEDNINIEEKKIAALKAMIEIYQRIIGPLSSVFLCWLGVLLSVGHRRNGKGISFGISLIVIFGYIGLANYAKIMILKNNFPVNLTMWLPNFVLFLMCIYYSIKKYRGN